MHQQAGAKVVEDAVLDRVGLQAEEGPLHPVGFEQGAEVGRLEPRASALRIHPSTSARTSGRLEYLCIAQIG